MHAALTVACLCLGDAFQGPPRLAPRRALRADGRNAAVAAVEAERRPLAARARTLFRFTRPHTFVGTAVAVPALHAYAAASAAALWSRACARSVAAATRLTAWSVIHSAFRTASAERSSAAFIAATAPAARASAA